MTAEPTVPVLIAGQPARLGESLPSDLPCRECGLRACPAPPEGARPVCGEPDPDADFRPYILEPHCLDLTGMGRETLDLLRAPRHQQECVEAQSEAPRRISRIELLVQGIPVHRRFVSHDRDAIRQV